MTDDVAWKPVGTSPAKPAADRRVVVIQAANFVRSQGRQISVSGTAAGSRTEFYHMPGTLKPPWASAGEAEIHVFQSSSCRAFKEIVSLVTVDDKTRCVTIGGRECATPILPGDRYFVENVLEELDSPGEWYLHRQTGELFYWPEANFSEKTEVVAPLLGRIIQILVRWSSDFLGRRAPIATLISRGGYADLQGMQKQAVPGRPRCPARTSSRRYHSPRAGAHTLNPLSYAQQVL